MTLYELKTCQRCRKNFECKAGNIAQCKCFSIPLSTQELELIKEQYDDCVCCDCLLELKKKFGSYKNKTRLEFINKLIGKIYGN